MSEINLGIYEHYKGKIYEVVGLARHSETLEEMVVYKALYEGEFPKGSLWVRPKSMFSEIINFQGKQVSRFKWLKK